MKLLVKHKILSFTGFWVTDITGKKLYSVKKRLISIGNKFKIYDMEGRQIAYIKEKIIKLPHTYYIYINQKQVAKVKKESSKIQAKLKVESIIGEYEVKQDLLKFKFYIEKNMDKIATIIKINQPLRQEYEVNISVGQSQSLILSLVIIMDVLLNKSKYNINKEDTIY